MTISLSTEFENLCLIDSFKKRVKTKNIGICTEFINKSNILNEKNSNLNFKFKNNLESLAIC